MNPWLKAKTFGMPRWAFIVLLAGGVAVGLYLRSRRSTAGEQPPPVNPSLDEFQDVGDPGLAGVGVVSPPGGVYPVTTPILPEGLTDLFGSLSGVITEQGAALAALPSAVEQPPPPVINVTAPATGGGPPNRPAAHAPAPRETNAEYLRRLREIRDRHGANSKEVKAFRDRHPDQRA